MSAGSVEFEALAAASQLQCDCHCHGCGYNLRGQPVRRWPATGMLLARCPECGRLHPVDQRSPRRGVWLVRLGRVAFYLWLIIMVGGEVGAGFWQGGMTHFTLEELTFGMPTVNAAGFGLAMHQRTPKPEARYLKLLLVMGGGTSLGIGLAHMLITVAVLHDRRRSDYVALACLRAALPAVAVLLLWRLEAPQLMGWGSWYVLFHTSLYLAGALAGVRWGRGLVRMVLRLALPPGARRSLAWLWLVDGKAMGGAAAYG